MYLDFENKEGVYLDFENKEGVYLLFYHTCYRLTNQIASLEVHYS